MADVNVQDNLGRTILQWVTENWHVAILRLLLDHKADINVKDNKGRTLLYLAAENGYKARVQLLLDHEADINTKDDLGKTALHRAAENRHEEVVQQLLDHKADVNVEDNLGRTALYQAAKSQYKKMVQLLLDHKADVNVKDIMGRTALYRAAENRHEEIVRLLLDHKADVNVQDNCGWTARQRAAKHGHQAVVRLLRWRELQQTAEDVYETVVQLLLYPLSTGADVAATLTQPELLRLIGSGNAKLTSNGSVGVSAKKHPLIVSTSSTSSTDINRCPQGLLGTQGTTEEERICQPGVTSTSRNCAVCSETIAIHEFPALTNCDHDPQVCAVCYKSWIASELDRKSCKEMACPESGCKRLLKHGEVQQYAAPEVYAR
jgi:predicted RNA-binding protein YlqC (UPF0109 family)